jgi:hypothetical protein
MNITSVTKEQVAQAIITQLEEQDNKISIKTGLFKTYKSPPKIIQKSINAAYYPDIQITTSDGHINIYEIELNTKINIEKWRVFSLFTKLKQGELFIIVPEPNLSAIKRIIVENNFKNIKLMYVHN